MSCRVCENKNLVEIISFGNVPLAGDFHNGSSAPRYPLTIDYCPNCTVLQVRDLVKHDILFNEQYCYASSTVPTLVAHFKAYAEYINECLLPQFKKPKLLEIGCNDGVLLKQLDALHIEAVGVDACANVAALAQLEGCLALNEVFTEESAGRLLKYSGIRGYDVITTSNVFAHNSDPNSFLRGVKRILSSDGYLLIEVHDSTELYNKNQWDCFYHEHCFYWSPYALYWVLNNQGFNVLSITSTNMHGGGLRVLATLDKTKESRQFPKIPPDWSSFGTKITSQITTIKNYVKELCERKTNVYLHGAAGRAAMLLAFCELDEKSITLAFDNSPLRKGKRIPGTEIKIEDEQWISLTPPGVQCAFILGAWHIGDVLVEKIRSLRSREDQRDYEIIKPLPSFEILK